MVLPNSNHKYVFLDGLRGVAAAAVMYAHLTGRMPWAAYAVDFFFILSGFVLAYAYAGKLRERSMSVSRFMVIRYRRLYPMLLLAVALAFAITLYRGVASPWELAGALTAIPQLNSTPHRLAFPLVGPEWSLSYEFAVNLGFAFLIRRTNGIALTFLFAPIYVLAVYLGYSRAGSGSADFLFGLPRVLFWFTAGVALWHVAPNLQVRLSGIWATLCSALGEMSYPLYILHYPLVWMMESINRRHQFDGVFPLIVEGLVIIALALAAALYIDAPLRRRLRNWPN